MRGRLGRGSGLTSRGMRGGAPSGSVTGRADPLPGDALRLLPQVLR